MLKIGAIPMDGWNSIFHEQSVVFDNLTSGEDRETSILKERNAYCRADVANTLHKLWQTSTPDCSPHHHWKITVFDSWLQSVQRELFAGKSPAPYASTVRKIEQIWTDVKKWQFAKTPRVWWQSHQPTSFSFECWLVEEEVFSKMLFHISPVDEGTAQQFLS